MHVDTECSTTQQHSTGDVALETTTTGGHVFRVNVPFQLTTEQTTNE